MLSLKTPIENELKSRVVYKLSFCGCNPIYVGQTVRQLNTRMEKHRKDDTPVGEHLQERGSYCSRPELKSEILDQTSNTQKLLKLKAIQIWREWSSINTRGEFKISDLILKMCSMNEQKYEKLNFK